MADTATAEATAPAEAPKKKTKKANLEWLKGEEVTKAIAEATGFRHTVISSDTIHDLDFEDIEASVRVMCMAHGVKQKSTDCASGARANAQDEDEAVEQLFQDFRDGNWRGDRGESVAGVRALAEAIAKLKGSTNVDGWIAEVTSWDEAKRDTWRKDARVKAEVAKARLARLEAKAAEATGLDDLPDMEEVDAEDAE